MKKLVFSIILLFVCTRVFGATWNITYPRPLTENDQRAEYPVKLLALALAQTGVNFSLEPTAMVLLQDKALKQLGENRNVNVVWSMTDNDREERLLPIRIPIYKGLIGWRLFMIHEDRKADFTAIDTMQGLQQYKPIQGYDWPDTKILQSNGFDVNTTKSYTGLFNMLAQQQGDFLPRSLIEVWAEYDKEDIDDSIIIEPTLGVKYPTAMYFFVNKNNRTLARLLEVGMEKAIKNGKFDALFERQFAESFKRADIENRFFFELTNPLLPETTPIDRKELWY